MLPFWLIAKVAAGVAGTYLLSQRANSQALDRLDQKIKESARERDQKISEQKQETAARLGAVTERVVELAKSQQELDAEQRLLLERAKREWDEFLTEIAEWNLRDALEGVPEDRRAEILAEFERTRVQYQAVVTNVLTSVEDTVAQQEAQIRGAVDSFQTEADKSRAELRTAARQFLLELSAAREEVASGLSALAGQIEAARSDLAAQIAAVQKQVSVLTELRAEVDAFKTEVGEVTRKLKQIGDQADGVADTLTQVDKRQGRSQLFGPWMFALALVMGLVGNLVAPLVASRFPFLDGTPGLIVFLSSVAICIVLPLAIHRGLRRAGRAKHSGTKR